MSIQCPVSTAFPVGRRRGGWSLSQHLGATLEMSPVHRRANIKRQATIHPRTYGYYSKRPDLHVFGLWEEDAGVPSENVQRTEAS